jgi:hypothetical protein
VQIPQMRIGAAGLKKTHASAASRMTSDSGVSTSQGDEKLSALDRIVGCPVITPTLRLTAT